MQGVKDVSLDLSVGPVELVQHLFYFLPLGGARGRTTQIDLRKIHYSGITPYDVLWCHVEGPYHCQCAFKEFLNRFHCTDGGPIEHIQEKSLDHIIFMMTKGNLVTPQVCGYFEKDLPPEARAEEAGILLIIRAVGLWAHIPFGYFVIKSMLCEKGCHVTR